MPPTGPDDRQENARWKRSQESQPQSAVEREVVAREPDDATAPQTEQSGHPPGIREESPPGPTRRPDAATEPTIAEEVSEIAHPASWSRAEPGQQPQSPPGYDRFGWPIPAGSDERQNEPPAQAGNRPDTSSWRIPPAPNTPPRGPYSGQFPVQPPPRQSGAFPAAPSDATRSGQFPVPPAPVGPDDRRSGQFPTAPRDPVTQSGAYAAPPEAGTGGYVGTASGAIPQSPYISGPMPRVSPQADAERRSGPFPYPSEVTSTGSRRVIVAPDAGVGSLLADRSALAFLLAAVVFVGAMIVYIALRYSHFPNQIALHFGPAGPGEPNRIGEKRELWTIPFIVGIVLAANTALAWAVYRYDRFAARLLTLGCALVGAIAWVVLLTLLHR
ncbi:MAG: DUF1648 domain-containing protein [Chloroflexota bacterium]|nr:DUF1648 domain-containing protein [Chloroflexota bacterium]